MNDQTRPSWTERFREFRQGFSREAPVLPEDEFALAALERHKTEGMRLAVRARLIALGVIAIMLPIINPRPEVLYYEAFAILFGLIGWAQLRAATIGRSRAELLLMIADIVLITIIVVTPNPFSVVDQPLGMQYRFGGHSYLFLYLALGTLAYSWRTVRGYGTLAAFIWMTGVAATWFFSTDHPASMAVREALTDYPFLAETLNPSAIRFDARFQEIVIFAIVAFILSMTVRRFGDLLLTHASIERERANLTRYFSPNMVEELSQNDDPLKQIRTQNVAVLFVDIVGFTQYSNERDPTDVIKTLREFHALMEKAVFGNGGTLDKFLGDGLMATFGTPVAGKSDALNALHCAQAMLSSVETWNGKRADSGDEPIRISLGLHFGPCVLGDIGGDNRLEFAVIGDTVNLASRVEAKTRELGVNILMTEEMADQVRAQSSEEATPLAGFDRFDDQEIRGLSHEISLMGAGKTFSGTRPSA